MQLHGKKMSPAEENRLRDKLNRRVPKKVYSEMSGRSAHVVNKQADRYGLPLRGRTVDLHAVVRSFHDFLAANAFLLAAKRRRGKSPGDEEFRFADATAEASGERSPNLEEWRKWKAKRAELEFKELQGDLVRADRVGEMLTLVARHYRTAAETVRKHYGPAACEIVTDAVAAAEREHKATIGDLKPAE